MFVREAMSTKVETVAPDVSLRDCAKKMRDLDIGALPVSKDGKLLGMITDRDICCRAIGDGWDTAAKTAKDLMSGDVTYCFDDQDCKDAAHMMEDKHLRRLAVLDRKQKRMVGLLSIDDLARCSHDLAGEVLEATSPPRH